MNRIFVGVKRVVDYNVRVRVKPDGTGVAYMVLGDDSTQIWITDLATNRPRQVTKTSLLTTFVTNFEFTNNGKQIVAVFPPDGRTPRPRYHGTARRHPRGPGA